MKASTTGSIVAAALAAIVALAMIGFRSASVEAAYPVEHARRTLATRVWTRVTGFFRGSAASAENAALRREVASLALLRGDVERLEAENDRLRQALGYVARHKETWLAAGVLSRDGGSAGIRNTIRADKGTLAGVKAGAVVVVPEGLVGRVTGVTPHTSEITLITDPSVKVSCAIEANRETCGFGILSGGGEELLVLRHLRNAENIPVRSRVLTSGRGGIFPPGLEVGTLLDVRKGANGLVREGEVLPLVDFSTLEDVFIRREK